MESAKKEIKIFVIEDDLIFTNILIDILDNIISDYQSQNIDIVYTTFYSAREASFELRKKPDIVLLDYYIMDDTLEPLTANDFLHDAISSEAKVDIILISGLEDQNLIEELKAKGIKAYLGKDPISLVKIEPTIKNIIEEILSR
jgi:response regulator of citrate/malate metabolism